jgi:hypothetical protein
MQKNHMDVFGLLHVVHRGQYGGSHPASQFSTIEAAQADRVSAKAIRVIDGLEDVGQISASGDSNHDIASTEEISQLLDEDILVGDIVGISRQGREVIIQTNGSKTLLPAMGHSFVEIASEVGG